jgi:hypothetical protein
MGRQYWMGMVEQVFSTIYICIPESGLTSLQDTATPVTIDNDASIQQTANVKNSKPGI